MKYSTVFYFRMWPLTISMGEIMRPLCCPQKKGPGGGVPKGKEFAILH